MFTRIGSLAISIAAVIAGIIAGVAIGVLISAPAGPRIEEYTITNFNHDAQELRTHTCLVWWQEAQAMNPSFDPSGDGKILACERLK